MSIWSLVANEAPLMRNILFPVLRMKIKKIKIIILNVPISLQNLTLTGKVPYCGVPFSIPCQLYDVIHVAESHDSQERSLFAAQAAKDWTTILLHRAKELAPGMIYSHLVRWILLYVIFKSGTGGRLCIFIEINDVLT